MCEFLFLQINKQHSETTDLHKFIHFHCLPVSDMASWQHLPSASQHLLVVPCHRFSAFGCRAFAVAGQTVWNSLLDNLRDPDVTIDNFKHLLKMFLFSAHHYTGRCGRSGAVCGAVTYASISVDSAPSQRCKP